MRSEDRLTACPQCGSAQKIPALRKGEKAVCRLCGHWLARSRDGLEGRLLALATTGVILFVLANSYAFVTMESGGNRRSLSLIESPFVLAGQGYPIIGALVGCFTLLLPLLSLAMTLWLLAALRMGEELRKSLPMLVDGLLAAKEWAMPDVFLLGALVSMVKLAGMANITPGVSFWAYAAFTFAFAALMSLVRRRELWDILEERRKA